jgi:hypothetical protein
MTSKFRFLTMFVATLMLLAAGFASPPVKAQTTTPTTVVTSSQQPVRIAVNKTTGEVAVLDTSNVGVDVQQSAFKLDSYVSFTANASQTSTNSVDPETVGGEVEVKAQLGESHFLLDNTTGFSMARHGGYNASHAFYDTALLRVYPNKHVFVGGGAQVARSNDGLNDFNSVNPALTGGVEFSIGKVKFEPYALVLTDDLMNDTKARSIGGGLEIKVPVNERGGFKFIGSAARNSYDSGFGRVEANNFGAGAGFYINF